MRSGHLKITVAALTRRRPNMVKELIESWGEMDLPENCLIECLIVENDEKALTKELVEGLNPLPNSIELKYVLETELGIPFGRNRAANEAIKSEHDLLVFVDDDEVVAKDWLVRLVEGYRNSDAVLLGAPVLAGKALKGLSRKQMVMYNCVTQRFREKARRAASKATLNTAPRVTILTGNWIAQTSLFTEHKLWFDEALRFTGGEDTDFCARVKALGLPVGWINDAFAYETIPMERLSFAYQYQRAKDQATTHFHKKKTKRPIGRYSALLLIPFKAIGVLFLAFTLPFNHGKSLLRLARTTGWIMGTFNGIIGRRSKLYTSVTGH